MDTNFQTSFIPKKSLAEERVPVAASGGNIVSFIATLIFLAVLASAGGLYFYRTNIKKTIASQRVQLDAARNQFEPTLIAELKRLDRRMTNANTIIDNHIVISPIFDALEMNTLKSIQFTKFSYLTPASTKMPVAVQMQGKARDYASIALESDQLATNKNIRNPIFSELALDEQTGMVSFNLTFTVDPELVRFTNHLSTFGPGAAASEETQPVEVTQ